MLLGLAIPKGTVETVPPDMIIAANPIVNPLAISVAPQVAVSVDFAPVDKLIE